MQDSSLTMLMPSISPASPGPPTVFATTASTASAAKDLGEAAVGAVVTIMCDNNAGTKQEFYANFDAKSVATAPDPTATTGDGRCVPSSNGRLDFTVTPFTRWFRIYPTGTGSCRYWISGPK